MKDFLMSQRGISLIEMSIVLSILGLVLTIVFNILPNLGSLPVSTADGQVLQRTATAVKGFLAIHSRLPCPDSDNDGQENCASTVRTGSLPYKDLELEGPVINVWGNPLTYSVYRSGIHSPAAEDTDLAALVDRFQPHSEPIPNINLPPAPEQVNRNGIDFCWALRTAIRKSHTPYEVHLLLDNPVNVAFVIADPGRGDSDNDGHILDAGNGQKLGFESPEKPLSDTYDDQVLATSLTQLAGEFNCPSLLSNMNSLSREVLAASSLVEIANANVTFREHAVTLAKLDERSAKNLLVLASIDIVLGGAEVSLATAGTWGTLGVGTASVPLATAALALAIANEVFAVADVESAKERLADAKETLDAAETLRDEYILPLAKEAEQRLVRADEQGWLP